MIAESAFVPINWEIWCQIRVNYVEIKLKVFQYTQYVL